jgi:hypothetical protein
MPLTGIFKKALAPSVALMHRLRYPYKLAVTGVVSLAAILLLFALLGGNVLGTMQATRMELVGLRVHSSVLALLRVAQQHRGMAQTVLIGYMTLEPARAAAQFETQAAVTAADAAMSRHAHALGVTAAWSLVNEQWAQLHNHGMQMNTEQNRLVQQLLKLMEDINDGSQLILDPDADTYNLMDAITLKLPMALEHMAQLRGHGLQVLANTAVQNSLNLETSPLY